MASQVSPRIRRPDPLLWTGVSCIVAGTFMFAVSTPFAAYLAFAFLALCLMTFMTVDRWMYRKSLRERIKELRAKDEILREAMQKAREAIRAAPEERWPTKMFRSIGSEIASEREQKL